MRWRYCWLVLVTLWVSDASAGAVLEWQRKLIGDGWVEIRRKLTDFTDHTWYGQKNETRSTEGWVYYLRPDGNTGVLRAPNGKTYVDHRSEGADGKICSLIKELRGGKQYCGNSLWKRGDLYMFTNPDGGTIHTWKWQKGNPEDFALDE